MAPAGTDSYLLALAWLREGVMNVHEGSPPAVNGDMLAVALRRRDAQESVTAIAAHLGIGRSTLYRTFAAYDEAIATTSEERRPDEE